MWNRICDWGVEEMTKLKLSCDVAPQDNIIFEYFEGRIHVEIIMGKYSTESTAAALNKSDVAKLIEFLNSLELEE
jgi:hypothetical protein